MRKNKHRGIESLKSRYGLMFIAPWFLGFVLFFAIPVFQSVWFSLSDVTLSNSGLCRSQPLPLRAFAKRRVYRNSRNGGHIAFISTSYNCAYKHGFIADT